MEEVLNSNQIEHFIKRGFVRIDRAFSSQRAAEVREVLWKDMAVDPDDPSTWLKPVIRMGMYDDPLFVEAANSPALHRVFDQLVGAGRWVPCRSMGTFPVRFPSAEDPGDSGWHVDVSFGDDPSDYFEWRVNWRSKNRGLLMLFLFSDVTGEDAPTRLRVGSHLNMAQVLKPHGERGLSLRELISVFDTMPARDEVLATGRAGTVYLCHPFLVHAAQRHRGTEPRFVAQPPLLLREELMLREPYSPVEEAIRAALR